MATLDDILTTQKNGVVAINNLSNSIAALYNKYIFYSGQYRSQTITSRTEVVRGSGQLVAIIVVDAGSAAGSIYDAIIGDVTLATGDGFKATISYTPAITINVGDTVYVTGIDPAGYNAAGGAPVTDVVNANRIKYVNATTAPYVTGGKIFQEVDSNVITRTPTTVGLLNINAPFSTGLVVDPGTGQAVNVIYSLN